MNAESEMAQADGLGAAPARTRDDVRAELEVMGAEVGEPGKLTWEEYDERKADLLEEALDLPDKAESTATVDGEVSAEQVAAGFNAARVIAAHLAEPGEWRGSEVCDVAATALIKAGLLTNEQCNN